MEIKKNKWEKTKNHYTEYYSSGRLHVDSIFIAEFDH